jgi:hypothetical protein
MVSHFLECIEMNCRCSNFFSINNNNLKVFRKFRFVSVSPVIFSSKLIYALAKVLFYEYIRLVSLFPLLIQLYIMTLIINYCHRYAHVNTYIHTFNKVTFDTGTNFPAVSWKSLLAVAMVNIRHRWNGIGVPTQSHPNAASLTLCAWKFLQLMFYLSVCHAALGSMYRCLARGV